MSAFSMHFARSRSQRAVAASERAKPGSRRRSAPLTASVMVVALFSQTLAFPMVAPALAQTQPPAVSSQPPAAQPLAAQAPAASPPAPAVTLPAGHPPLPQSGTSMGGGYPSSQTSGQNSGQPAVQTSGQPPASANAPVPGAASATAPNAPATQNPPAIQAALPHDLSAWGMFMAADWVVKAVMIGLAVASLVTWTIWLAKSLELMAARRRALRALRNLRNADSLAQAISDNAILQGGPVSEIVAAAETEEERSVGLPAEGIKERVAIALSRIEARAGRNMARGTGLLATIGSTAPFVGLFGTVWGIMNSFIGIAVTKTTSLAVVAPGIAEALLATAIGLVAAIPAVIIYNVFSRSITGYRALLSDASALALQHLSRDLDRRDVGVGADLGSGHLRRAAE